MSDLLLSLADYHYRGSFQYEMLVSLFWCRFDVCELPLLSLIHAGPVLNVTQTKKCPGDMEDLAAAD